MIVLRTRRTSYCWMLRNHSLLSEAGEDFSSPHLYSNRTVLLFPVFLHLGLPWRFCLDREMHGENGEMSAPGVRGQSGRM